MHQRVVTGWNNSHQQGYIGQGWVEAEGNKLRLGVFSGGEGEETTKAEPEGGFVTLNNLYKYYVYTVIYFANINV